MRFDIVVDDHGLAKRLESKGIEVERRGHKLVSDISDAVQFSVKRAAPRGKTSKLKASIRNKPNRNRGVVYVDEGIAPYASYVIEGRGGFGPKNKKALHFFVDGKEVFTKRVGPSKPNNFFKKGFEQSQAKVDHLVNKFGKWLGTL